MLGTGFLAQYPCYSHITKDDMTTINTIQSADKVLEIDYPIDKVKLAIMNLFKAYPSKYILRKNDINEEFNTYHFPISNNLNPAIMDITLKSISPDKTEIKLVVTNAYGSLSSNSILAGILSDYLAILAKSLRGEVSSTPQNSGCLIIFLIFMSSIIASAFVFL